ncbi:MAG: hypothetical protein WD556_13425 [Actinomycetota bacterium]
MSSTAPVENTNARRVKRRAGFLLTADRPCSVQTCVEPWPSVEAICSWTAIELIIVPSAPHAVVPLAAPHGVLPAVSAELVLASKAKDVVVSARSREPLRVRRSTDQVIEPRSSSALNINEHIVSLTLRDALFQADRHRSERVEETDPIDSSTAVDPVRAASSEDEVTSLGRLDTVSVKAAKESVASRYDR